VGINAAPAVDYLMSITSMLLLNGNPLIHYFDINRQVEELAWNGNKWISRHVGAEVGAKNAREDSSITSTTLNGNPSVYYININSNIHELAWDGNKWNSNSLVPNAGPSWITSTTINGWPFIYYFGKNNQVEELAWNGNKWIHRFVGQKVGAPSSPTAYYDLTSTKLNGNLPRVYYTNDHYMVQELGWDGNKWFTSSVGADVGAVDVQSGPTITSTTLNGNPQVYYIGTDDNVHELSWLGNQLHWHHGVLTKQLQAPLAFRSIASTTFNGDPRVYYYGLDDYMVHELSWNGNKWHYRPVGKEAKAKKGEGPMTATNRNDKPSVYYLHW
jgi:hypothetical protein